MSAQGVMYNQGDGDRGITPLFSGKDHPVFTFLSVDMCGVRQAKQPSPEYRFIGLRFYVGFLGSCHHILPHFIVNGNLRQWFFVVPLL